MNLNHFSNDLLYDSPCEACGVNRIQLRAIERNILEREITRRSLVDPEEERVIDSEIYEEWITTENSYCYRCWEKHHGADSLKHLGIHQPIDQLFELPENLRQPSVGATDAEWAAWKTSVDDFMASWNLREVEGRLLFDMFDDLGGRQDVQPS